MAFKCDSCVLLGYEYRSHDSGSGEKGTWHSIRLESPSGKVCEVSVPSRRPELINIIGMLQRGNCYDFPVVVTATGSYNGRPPRAYIQLDGTPIDSIRKSDTQLDAEVEY